MFIKEPRGNCYVFKAIIIITVRKTVSACDCKHACKYKNIYACIINVYVPHAVKNQSALVKRIGLPE